MSRNAVGMKAGRVIMVASLLFLAGPGFSQENTDAAELERKLTLLRSEITELQDSLQQSRSEYSTQQNQLKEIELAIQQLSRSLREIAASVAEQNERLAGLIKQRTSLLSDLGLEKEELAQLIRSAHQLGYPSRLKLMLNQDDFSGLSRNLAYYRYFNSARLEQINMIRDRLVELDQLEDAIKVEQEALQQLRSERATELERQDATRAERQLVAQNLARRIDEDQHQLEEMQNNRNDLEKLLERLSKILVDIPAGLGQNLVLSEHKGNLPPPLEGRILYAFGNQRGGGMRWQGWLYAVAAGTEVRSVAYGRVAFSDWLRGYGLLMIIDHGDGFMSLYGHNDSLLRDVGDWVQTGELISLSGASGGLARDGLYFELRKDGNALDPSGWISR